MKLFLLIALLLSTLALAQPPVRRIGIRVEMVATRSGTLMREADQAGSLVVAVTRSGEAYLEATPVTLAALTEQLRAARSAPIYIKADTRATYGSVAAVLTALRAAGADVANLLSSQRDPSGAPMGVSVSLSGVPDSREKTVNLDATGPLLFGDVVSIIDASRAAGARVVLK